ncbi:von willebrand factor [Ophiostoma piceae UAMH 11346]|uniref:von willebrand factor n=1 Tax=Ophiostoma piceae (strain UAMH 11346) TaxID=1262450 RepID=S3BTM2_OPHP1|nr:von willebrand factor [Ophiostoma piceae UAMH 11346]
MADSSNNARLRSPRHATNASAASDTTTNSSQSGSRRSIIGSFRDRFSRRPANGDGRSPLANPSSPTRRPPQNEPPPPYSAVGAPPAELPTPAAAPAPAPAPAASRSIAPPPAPAAASAPVHAPAPAAPASDIGAFRSASPAPSNRSVSSRLTVDNLRSAEDPFAFLATFDTVFVIDDSGSMAGRPWREVHAVLTAIVPICTERDADGVDIYFLNHRCTPQQQQLLLGQTHQQGQPRVPPGKSAGGFHNVRTNDAVGRIFNAVKPSQSTPTGMRLGSILKPYLRFYEAKRKELEERGEFGDPDPEEVKPMNIIVITDGVPTDDLEDVLVDAAKKLDSMDAPPYQVGVQFFQVGTEPDAAAYLKHLDDTLGQNEPNPIRDMVDTVTWDSSANVGSGSNANRPQPLILQADAILKTVLGAVVKRLDKVTVATRGGRGAAARGPRNYTNTLHP